jgi:NAD(P)-dependent dehydrogenase (short-subunit alcohol dehydrogenase family)
MIIPGGYGPGRGPRRRLPEATIEQIRRDEAARIPLGRRGEPGEVAIWILRPADTSTTWLTGQVLTIDGGLELS